jgi:DNA-binding MltR family transcriptional regulator
MKERILEIKMIGNVFTNQFGYPSRKVGFFDPVSRLSKSIFIHQKHAGHYAVWKMIEETGVKTKLKGEIKIIKIDEALIRSISTYEHAKIKGVQSQGTFVIIEFSDLNELGNLQMALKNQLYNYVSADGQIFDPYELTDVKYLRKQQ